MPAYNKLVRDKIPQIIIADGKKCTLKTLSEDEYAKELREKLGEELREYLEVEDGRDAIEELADLMELIHALAGVHGATPEELEQVRSKKAEERGGFTEKVFLIDVEE
ncbi:nucleoside triphosphate pyrophosphohydrolase [Alicyclobacillus tolerans]|uniref:nucleoside triphosphate pyrophosphohydrolase n=1 Tax=Alicyclobacillus tolerans TaxID=90970 RepID=UPI001F2DF7E1|nr:nucleoside triphosphate pyrophosphohydrolase [Alicyclobacillus tolerans]MCF8566511.1 nucleoside triphosphate pyrophosphohydrolase [Alicyclobacillus tolerans]